MNFVKRFLEYISVGERWVGGLCFLLLTLVMIADVVKREAIDRFLPSMITEWIGLGGIIWAQKLSLYFMLWGGLFGCLMASAKGAHLRPEIADKLIPKALEPYVKIAEQLVISMFFSFLAYLSVLYVKESFAGQEQNPVTDIYLWMVQLIFIYVFSSMGIRHLAYAIFPKIRPEEINEATEALAEAMEGNIGLEKDQGKV